MRSTRSSLTAAEAVGFTPLLFLTFAERSFIRLCVFNDSLNFSKLLQAVSAVERTAPASHAFAPESHAFAPVSHAFAPESHAGRWRREWLRPRPEQTIEKQRGSVNRDLYARPRLSRQQQLVREGCGGRDPFV